MGKSYRELEVWKASYGLVHAIYALTERMPKHETYGLVSQMQRAAVSIPSNIAEGQQRRSAKEFKQFLYIARGSAAELATQLQLFGDIYLQDVSRWLTELDRIQRMLFGLIKSL